MIQMRVGIENTVNPGQIFSQCLLPQIGPRVDENRILGRLEMDGGACPLEFRVRRYACGTAAPDDRNTGGCAGAQKGKTNFRFQLGLSFA